MALSNTTRKHRSRCSVDPARGFTSPGVGNLYSYPLLEPSAVTLDMVNIAIHLISARPRESEHILLLCASHVSNYENFSTHPELACKHINDHPTGNRSTS